MTVDGARKRMTAAVTRWKGVTAALHRFSGTEQRLGACGIGHIHGGHMVDIPSPTRVRPAVVAACEAEPRHLLSDSGWVSFYIRHSDDVDRATALLRRSIDNATRQRRGHTAAGDT